MYMCSGKYEISSILYMEIKNLFPKIRQYFSKEEYQGFLDCAQEDIVFYHFGLGTKIRNEILQEQTVLYEQFCKEGIVDKDTMSMIIIEELYISVH